jgi:FkbM family methyltransferase
MDELERTLMTLSCEDCAAIPKVPNAGSIVVEGGRSVQIMHNGLRVVAGGYHGDWMAHIIRGLRGHHEPQEELIFHSLLRYTRHNSLIVELGAFWAYYTLWYLRDVPGSRGICVEPDAKHVAIGQMNAEHNNVRDRIQFVEAWVDGEASDGVTRASESTSDQRSLPSLDMNAVAALASGRTIELLHMDVQGAELPFLRSMEQAIRDKAVRFVVVSTHHRLISGSPTTHEDCLRVIRDLGGRILSEHNISESYSGDGLIAASFFPQDRSMVLPKMSRNRAATSLFPES